MLVLVALTVLGFTTLVVSNLHYEITPKDLVSIFGQVGTLVREPLIRYDRSGRSSGVAIISFETAAEATRAKKQFDGKLAKGLVPTGTLATLLRARQPMDVAFDTAPPRRVRSASMPGVSTASLLNRIERPSLAERLGGGEESRKAATTGPIRPRAPRSSRGGATPRSKAGRPTARPKAKTAEELDQELDVFMDGTESKVAEPVAVSQDVEMCTVTVTIYVYVPSGKMHRCLSILEIQRAIFREVYPRIQVLARLARTCRAFNGSALDELWATLDSFTFLVKCLPRDLWRIDPVDKKMVRSRASDTRHVPTDPGLSGLPTTHDTQRLADFLQIFLSRACRGKSPLDQQCITGCLDLGDDVIFSLSNPPSYGPLIPCLKELYWDKPTKKYASLLRMLFTPSLVAICLTTSDYTLRSPEATILTSIGTACPSLRSLCISSRMPLNILHSKSLGISGPTPFTHFLDIDIKGDKVLSEAVMCMHSLESLVCPALDEEAFIHLSRLSALNELWMDLPFDFHLDRVKPLLAPQAFRSINTLALEARSLSTLTSILESMQFSPSQVSFRVVKSPSLDAIRLFFIVLVNACCSERLSRVSLSAANEKQYSPPPQQLTLSTFEPLLALPHIDMFELNVPRGISLDDANIITLAEHWPKLTQLSINAMTGWGTSTRVTHQGLIALLSRCVDLMSFALSVDLSGIDVPTSELPVWYPGHGVKNDNCQCAKFVTSVISHPAAIMAFLSDICPQLTTVMAAWDQENFVSEDPDDGGVYLDRWEKVEVFLPEFMAVRRQRLGWMQMKTEEDVGAA
ncbi:hypothetical protein BU15DRAFT_80363 [Melanogaster broomeanus]|nr:hypothetical protein BU15DRAFT_80363 [Melanogaster broomeanus]